MPRLTWRQKSIYYFKLLAPTAEEFTFCSVAILLCSLWHTGTGLQWRALAASFDVDRHHLLYRKAPQKQQQRIAYCGHCRQAVQLSQRDRAAGWVSFGWVVGDVVDSEWVRQYSTVNVVGARKLKALVFYTMNPLLYEKRSLCVLSSSLGEGVRGNVCCSS